MTAWYRTRLGLIRRADRVLAISEATARDAIERLGLPEERVVVVGAGVSERFHPPASRERRLRGRCAEPAVAGAGVTSSTRAESSRGRTSTGCSRPMPGLPEALRARHQLVIVCRVLPHERTVLDAQLRRLGVADRVRFPGFVPDEDLLRLYQAAELFVFPALYEGFGLPIAEAIASGTPVIAVAQLGADGARHRRGGSLRSAGDDRPSGRHSSAPSPTMPYASDSAAAASRSGTRGEALPAGRPRPMQS